jgi:hypothetical protein
MIPRVGFFSCTPRYFSRGQLGFGNQAANRVYIDAQCAPLFEGTSIHSDCKPFWFMRDPCDTGASTGKPFNSLGSATDASQIPQLMSLAASCEESSTVRNPVFF